MRLRKLTRSLQNFNNYKSVLNTRYISNNVYVSNINRSLFTKSPSETVIEEQKEEISQDQSKEETVLVEENEDKIRIKTLEEELKDMKNNYLRELAETENIRKRNFKEVENVRNYSIQSFAKQLLEVGDNLKRAVESVPQDIIESKEVDPNLSSLFDGVKMTQKELEKVLQKNKVVEYGLVGEKFDPNLHNALFNMEDETKEKGTIGQVLKTGFKFGERVLRPADVGIFK